MFTHSSGSIFKCRWNTEKKCLPKGGHKGRENTRLSLMIHLWDDLASAVPTSPTSPPLPHLFQGVATKRTSPTSMHRPSVSVTPNKNKTLLRYRLPTRTRRSLKNKNNQTKRERLMKEEGCWGDIYSSRASLVEPLTDVIRTKIVRRVLDAPKIAPPCALVALRPDV